MRKLQVSNGDRAAMSLVKFLEDRYVLTIIKSDSKGFYEFIKASNYVVIKQISRGRTISTIKSSISSCGIYIAQLFDDEEIKYATIDDDKKEIVCSRSNVIIK